MGLYVNTGHIKTIISVEVQPNDRISNGEHKMADEKSGLSTPSTSSTTKGITRELIYYIYYSTNIHTYVHTYMYIITYRQVF